ncbi:MAG: hypothetical protein MJ240_12265, partial [Kiritimatiellae bacterium]|nr:hypothetical protein [Kiritimatiellia bacterium]
SDPIPTAALLEGFGAQESVELKPKAIPAVHAPLPSTRGRRLDLSTREPNRRAEGRPTGDKNYYASKSHRERIVRGRERLVEVFAGCPNTIKDAFLRVDDALSQIEGELSRIEDEFSRTEDELSRLE